jgi:hypothetical protein
METEDASRLAIIDFWILFWLTAAVKGEKKMETHWMTALSRLRIYYL